MEVKGLEKKIQLNKLQYGLLHITSFQIKNVVSLWTRTPNGRFDLMIPFCYRQHSALRGSSFRKHSL